MRKQVAPRKVPLLTTVMLMVSPVVSNVNEAMAETKKNIEPV